MLGLFLLCSAEYQTNLN